MLIRTPLWNHRPILAVHPSDACSAIMQCDEPNCAVTSACRHAASSHDHERILLLPGQHQAWIQQHAVHPGMRRLVHGGKPSEAGTNLPGQSFNTTQISLIIPTVTISHQLRQAAGNEHKSLTAAGLQLQPGSRAALVPVLLLCCTIGMTQTAAL